MPLLDTDWFDRIRETCSAPGLGNVALLGAPQSYSAFADRLSSGRTFYGFIADQDGPKWEVGLYTFSGGAVQRPAITVLDGSSGPGVAVNFSSGTQDILLDVPASVLGTIIAELRTIETSAPSRSWMGF